MISSKAPGDSCDAVRACIYFYVGAKNGPRKYKAFLNSVKHSKLKGRLGKKPFLPTIYFCTTIFRNIIVGLFHNLIDEHLIFSSRDLFL